MGGGYWKPHGVGAVGATMRTIVSLSVQKSHPNLETILWHTACIAKSHDNDIMIGGLLVRITKSPTTYWSGVAYPLEETCLYNKKLIHPAGRIDLRVTTGMITRSIATLFAHELKHIGDFHRGRKRCGVLSDEGDIRPLFAIEDECIKFEKMIAAQVMRGTTIYRGTDQPDSVLS